VLACHVSLELHTHTARVIHSSSGVSGACDSDDMSSSSSDTDYVQFLYVYQLRLRQHFTVSLSTCIQVRNAFQWVANT